MPRLAARSVSLFALCLLAPLSLAAAGCGSAAQASLPRLPDRVSLADMDGTWHVVESTFPMWSAGDKANPAFNYAVIQNDERTGLIDLVTYREDGKDRVIEGFDTQDPADDRHFTWRGAGVLRLFGSDWYVTLRAPDRSWAVIYFTATLATPEGLDIIARTPDLPPATLGLIHAAIAREPALRARSAGLVPVVRRAP
jgi:hypothetical protein